LVVDDNKDAANSLTTLLELLGHEARAAFDGPDAVEAAAEFRPHVVLLDIGLPKLSGYAVARQIRSLRWGQDVVLVAVTGWGQESDRRSAMEAGFDRHLTKPLTLETLQTVLDFVRAREPSSVS
jgi:CheY-like chemotaxis protein